MHILCAFGCVYQMYNLNVIYFSYETTTNVRYETQTDTYLPAITMCYRKWIQNNYHAQFNHENHSAILDSIANMTISEQFKLFGNSPSKLIFCGTWRNGHAIHCDQVANYFQYLDKFWYCFTIFLQLKGEPDINYLVSS